MEAVPMGPPGMPPPGAPGNGLPMQMGGQIPGTPAAPPGVPALPGLPAVAPMPGAAPAMGPMQGPQGGGSYAPPGQAFQNGFGGGGQMGYDAQAYGALPPGGGGAAIPAMRGVSPSRAGLPQQQPLPWQQSAREMTR